MRLPKDGYFFLFDEFVVGIGGSGPFEWRSARKHNEEDHSCCENICLPAIVFLAEYLRGHVPLRSKHGLQNSLSVPSLEQAAEAEVGYLQLEGLGKQ